MNEVLLPTVLQRLDERDCGILGHEVPRYNDCIQWVMQSSAKSKPWSAQRIVHELMALWFGSVHITFTTACFALHDLCLHPEYIKPLRNEITSTGWTAFEDSRGQGLPLLDSFIKESARTNPVEASMCQVIVSTRRMALKTFQLSDGTTIEPGGWVCTAVRAMASDPAYFARPQEFHGFRFVDRGYLETVDHGADYVRPPPGTKSGLTEVAEWQLWGTGRCA
ncbi:ent-kaurene oxidase [Diaporthe eres]|nr:ent-kaurene oxidase [Diaporthe eres]